MNCIVGIHGRKQSGKDTLADGIIDTVKTKIQTTKSKATPPIIKKICFADSLKQITMSLFQANEGQVYGSNSEKNSEIPVYWSDMVALLDTDSVCRNDRDRIVNFLVKQGIVNEMPYVAKAPRYNRNKIAAMRLSSAQLLPADPFDWKMTSREFLQFFGTEVIRRLHTEAWINAWASEVIKKCSNERKNIILVPDVRFINEIRAIAEIDMVFSDKGLKGKGMLIKLLRHGESTGKDQHESETGLDDGMFDLCIPDMPIRATLQKATSFLRKKGVI